ncbi:MAG: hypothetical protein WDN69_18955 [Aliidongia sp.]
MEVPIGHEIESRVDVGYEIGFHVGMSTEDIVLEFLSDKNRRREYETADSYVERVVFRMGFLGGDGLFGRLDRTSQVRNRLGLRDLGHGVNTASLLQQRCEQAGSDPGPLPRASSTSLALPSPVRKIPVAARTSSLIMRPVAIEFGKVRRKAAAGGPVTAIGIRRLSA